MALLIEIDGNVREKLVSCRRCNLVRKRPLAKIQRIHEKVARRRNKSDGRDDLGPIQSTQNRSILQTIYEPLGIGDLRTGPSKGVGSVQASKSKPVMNNWQISKDGPIKNNGTIGSGGRLHIMKWVQSNT